MYLAEDDDDVRQTLAALLTYDGFLVRAAPDGAMMFDWLFRERGPGARIPDVIVTDHRMPGYCALDILEALAEIRWTIPVIVITAYGAEVRSLALAYGAHAVFEKPFEPEALRIEAMHCVNWNARGLVRPSNDIDTGTWITKRAREALRRGGPLGESVSAPRISEPGLGQRVGGPESGGPNAPAAVRARGDGSQDRALLGRYLDVFNRAIAKTRHRFPFHVVLAALHDEFAGRAVLVEIADEREAESRPAFTCRLEGASLVLTQGPIPPATTRWILSREHIDDVIERPWRYLIDPLQFALPPFSVCAPKRMTMCRPPPAGAVEAALPAEGRESGRHRT